MTLDIKEIYIPTKPGCYLYKNSSGKIIYVGKAKNLRNRVKSYFSSTQLDPKTQKLVNSIRDLEFITTNNEVEALLLEQSLIHRHQPKFNIDLKGSIRYAYIKITDEKFPRIVTSRKVDTSGIFYGPYTDGTARRQIIGTLIKLFKIRTCVRLPKKACLQYHIGNCQAPCENRINQEDYMANVRNAERLLRGEAREIVADIKIRMKEASAEKKYEIAKTYRDQIDALTYAQEKQNVDQLKTNDQDVINWLERDGKIHVQVFNVLKGVITSRHTFKLDDYPGVIDDFINHFYSIHYIPEEIILPRHLEDYETVTEYLRRTKQEKFSYYYLPKVSITVPSRGTKKELLALVRQNLESHIGLEPGLLELQKKLQLSRVPMIIDFFDISNLKDQYIVGACIQLVNGEFHKNHYRKFRIKWQKGQNDVAAMREVVYRRYNRLLEEGKQLPDLICIDGGRGQLNAAVQALAELELQGLPVCGLAKREEEIYLPGKPAPLRLNQSLPGIRILMKGRDEVHRFVLAYNRKLRKEIFGS